MEIDRTLLAKLLSMTDSTHDAEALAAIRKANQLLRIQAMTWSDVLQTPRLQTPRLEAPDPVAFDAGPAPGELPPGYQRAAQYRDVFLSESIILRLLAFPFWIFVEVLAGIAPEMPLNTRGKPLSLVFALCMLLSVAVWLTAAYFLVFELD
jgi:hypothetical protein